MLIPATRYADPDAALSFLTDVLGLQENLVVRDGSGRIVHAQLSLGSGLMMLGPDDDTPFGAFMVPPRETGGRETTTIYAVVPDVAERFARVLDVGAEILLPLEEQDYGGSSFTLRDPEGHVWTLGDYDPRGSG